MKRLLIKIGILAILSLLVYSLYNNKLILINIRTAPLFFFFVYSWIRNCNTK